MDNTIVVALIGAGAMIIAAIINKIGKKERTTNIKQISIGKNNKQTGIQEQRNERDL